MTNIPLRICRSLKTPKRATPVSKSKKKGTPVKIRALLGMAAIVVAQTFLSPALVPAAAEDFGLIRFNTFGPSITSLPMRVATEKGFDKAEGFSSEFTAATGSVAIKAMIAGDFDFTLSAGSALAAAVSGAPIKVVYVHVDKSLYFLYARDDIKDIKSLEGKKIGIDAVGGSQDVAVRRAMKDAGADASKSTFLAIGYQNIPPSLIAGALDAGVITPPKEFALRSPNVKFVNLGFLGDLVPGLTGGIATTDRVIRQRLDMVRAVLRAHAKAHQFILTHRDETIAIMAPFLGLSMEDAATSYDTTVLPVYSKTAVSTPEVRQAIVDELGRSMKVAKTPELAKLFDFSLLPQ
jgi:NitT/TauT family transport system substrate-binding protein